MAYLTTDDLLNVHKDMIMQQFPNVPLEFSGRVYEDHLELWVYVLDAAKYEDVKSYCKNEVQPLRTEPAVPVCIYVKTWSGPWPGGESEQELKRRREIYRERIERRLHPK